MVAMSILQSSRLARAGFAHAFPERGTEDLHLWTTLGASGVAQARQVHGAHAVEASEAGGVDADAIIGRSTRIATGTAVAVGVRVADCVPVLVADTASGDVVAIHAGWRGIVAGVLRSAVEGLDRSPGSLLAAIGPSIGPCCFEVGRDVADAIARACPGADVVVRLAGEKAFVDLRMAVRAQLRTLGVPATSIEDVPGCSRHEPDRFHSFRREGAASGRMLAAISPLRYDNRPASVRPAPRST
jgi:YfiH family protein